MHTSKGTLNSARIFGLASLAVCSTLTSGCAGPATPLGAIWDLRPQWQGSALTSDALNEGFDEDGHSTGLRPSELDREPSRKIASFLGMASPSHEHDPKIQFDPPRQWLHGPHSLKVIIDDPRGVGRDYGFEVRYHGYDVTRSFLMQAKVMRENGGARLSVEVPQLRLSPSSEHLIEVGYSNPTSGKRAVSRLGAPYCSAFGKGDIKNLDEFSPDPALLRSLETISKQMGFNPAFAAALVAQESAFNPQSVSLARALGLTQVTALAEEEVADSFPRWPRYPGLNGLPAPILKWLVMSGEINAKNEWRLDPAHSIRGGLAFAQRLADRWLDSESFSKVNWSGTRAGPVSEVDVARTRLILASYNSGYARVTQAIDHYGAAWLTAPELKEARKYVNRIFSYCDAFERVPEGTEAPRVPRIQGGQGPEWPHQNFDPLSPSLIQRVMNENQT